jgi:hypothetical protein
MLQVYVLNVSPVSDICCISYTDMLQAYVCNVSCYFRRMLQQVLLPTRSDSRAHTCCTHPAISVMQASSNSRMYTQQTVSAQMAEHFLVKVHARMQIAERQSGLAPNARRTRRPCTTRRAPPPHGVACSQVKGYVRYAPLSHAATCSPMQTQQHAWASTAAARADLALGAGAGHSTQVRGCLDRGARPSIAPGPLLLASAFVTD